jgi:hypothetical protein
VVVACKVSTNLDQVIALEVGVPNGGQLEFGDTLVPTARALNGHGDSVAADIIWVTLDTAVLTVLDTATGETRGDSVAQGRLQARVGALRSPTLPITVINRIDSLELATGASSRDTVTLPDSSDSLKVQLFGAPAASGRRVVFTASIFPVGGPAVTFFPNDTVFSNATGSAFTRVTVPAGGPAPDSVVIVATVPRPDGTLVADSVMFVVVFQGGP